VVAHLREMLASGAVEHVMINHLSLDDPVFKDLGGRGTVLEIVEPHWITRVVPGSFEQTMEHHKSKTRKRLRPPDQTLSARFGDATLRIYTRPEDVEAFVGDASEIARHTYQAVLGAAVTDDPKWRTLLHAQAKGSYFQSYVLVADGRPIAYQQGTRSK